MEFAKQEMGKDVGQMSVERRNKDQPLSKYAEKKHKQVTSRTGTLALIVRLILYWQTPSTLLKL